MTVTTNSLSFATTSKLQKSTETKMMVIDGNFNVIHDNVDKLIQYINEGDILVVNNSSTLPSSFLGYHERSQESIEIRLVQSLNSKITDISKWKIIIFGEGDWRIPTEDRKKAPKVELGDILQFKSDLIAKVIGREKNLFEIEFMGTNNEIWHKLYEAGQPTQYSYLEEELHLYDQQTIFSGPPLSLEPNSAAFQLTWEIIDKLKRKGVILVTITHAISLSSTANEGEFDSLMLPFPERYWISKKSVEAINEAILNGKRIIAIGTSVTRALESASDETGLIKHGSNITNLKINKDHKLKVVSGLLTGMHIPGASHIDLLQAFIPLVDLDIAYMEAKNLNYKWHEYGDVSLIFKQAEINS